MKNEAFNSRVTFSTIRSRLGENEIVACKHLVGLEGLEGLVQRLGSREHHPLY